MWEVGQVFFGFAATYGPDTGRLDCPGCEGKRWRGVGTARWCSAQRAVSGFGRFEELAHGVVGSSGVMAMCLGQVIEAPLESHDADGQIGQAGEVTREIGRAYAAPVFVVGDVTHVVQAIFESSIGLLLFQSKSSAFQFSIQHTETRQ